MELIGSQLPSERVGLARNATCGILAGDARLGTGRRSMVSISLHDVEGVRVTLWHLRAGPRRRHFFSRSGSVHD